MKYLVDTNVWLELLLRQTRAEEARAFFERIEANQLVISEFSLYSLGVILARLKKDRVFTDFLSDTMEDAGVTCLRLEIKDLKRILTTRRQFQLDFDDAYQYVVAEKHKLTLVSFDHHFVRTPRGRKTPAEIVAVNADDESAE